jgi:xanthine dehydrogenase YagT iron-sulfur-binding subunit
MDVYDPNINFTFSPSTSGGGDRNSEEFHCSALSGKINRREFVLGIGGVTGTTVFGISAHGARAPVAEQTTEEKADTFPLKLRVNGEEHSLSIDTRVTLLDLLRETLGLTGTKKGCDHGQCGACTVLTNGRRINSCLSLALSHEGDEITTIEGMGVETHLSPLQAAFLEHDGFQCGYCTPGQICSAAALLEEHRKGDVSFVSADLRSAGPVKLTPEEIRERMSGNICRCGAYPGIVAAIQAVKREK